jgi:hypothetical protein
VIPPWAYVLGARYAQIAFHQGHYASWEFNQPLGEMRGVFGIYIAILVTTHGLDVEDGLAAIVPGRDQDERATDVMK